MKTVIPLLLSTAACGLLSAQTTTLLNEQFNPGDFSAYSGTDPAVLDPNTGTNAWYFVNRTQTTDNFFVSSEGELVNLQGGGGGSANFSSFTLANPGDSITIDVVGSYMPVADGNANLSFRFGLFDFAITENTSSDQVVTGLRLDAAMGTGSSNRWVSFSGDGSNLGGGGADSTSNFTGASLTSDTRMIVTYTRNALDGLDLTLAFGDAPNTSVVAAANVTLDAGDVPTYTFSNFTAISTNGDGYSLDSVVVTGSTIPEPSSTALIFGGLLSMFVMVRRRR